MTIKEIFESKKEQLGFDYVSNNLKSYNGLVHLDYDLLKDTELESNEYELYYSEKYDHITLRISNIDTESKLLKIQNELIDTQKINDFKSKLKHYIKKYGMQIVVDTLNELGQ